MRPLLLFRTMAAVYILYSKSIDSFYIGSCNELINRMTQHVNKLLEQSFTKRASDWELYFVVEGLEYVQVRKIEKHIKKMKSKKYIVNLKKYPEIFEKLKRKYL